MQHELSTDQARAIARLRSRHPGAELLVHRKPWGLIVEVRRGRHTLELGRFDWAGGAAPDRSLRAAA